jgi:putative ABC transport system permease protein
MTVGGLLPALSLTRRSLRETIGSGNDTSLPRWRGRSNLIALQVGVSVGLFLVAFSASRAISGNVPRPGPQLEGLAVATVSFTRHGYDAARTRAALAHIGDILRRTPGVSSAGVVAGLSGRDAMFLTNYRRTAVTTVDRPFSDVHSGTHVSSMTGDAEMFRLLGLEPRTGRVFTSDDLQQNEPVVVISEGLAHELFGAADITDRPLVLRTGLPGESQTEEVVRVLGTVASRESMSSDSRELTVYLPLSQHDESSVAILVRGSEELPVEPLRRALHSVDPQIAPAFIGDGSRLGAIERVALGTATTIAHALAAFALFLALTGLYGVLSHVVALRSRELAVRTALGASGRHITAMVVGDGLRPVAEGLLLAIVSALAIQKLLSVSLVASLTAIDLTAFSAAAGLLVAGGLAACLLPARRAARIDPNDVLKAG